MRAGVPPALVYFKDTIMLKKYTSRSHACINVVLPSGGNRHVSFTPRTGGGSVFYTEDAELQKAMEGHYKFGKLYTVEVMEKQEKEADTGRESRKVAVMRMSDADAAKDYLSDKYGISRTKMKSTAQIKAAGLAKGIEFTGF